MVAYYNEIDPFAAQWLRNLIDAGHIAPGVVDTRSVEDVTPNDLIGFNQCHFFAGIGGWPYALRLAGVAEDRPVWTGSPPCQPFSQAGQVKTPTMLITGEQDFRTPISQTEQMFGALKLRGVDAEMIRLPGAGHGMGRPSQWLQSILAPIDWFNERKAK